jgi:hypothetical protein
VSGAATLTVTPKPVAQVEVTPAGAELRVGEMQAFSVTVRDASGEELTGRSVSWASDAPSVATVDGDGVVTAVAPGTATLEATSEGVSGAATLTVTPKPVAQVEVTPAGAELRVGETQAYAVTVRDASGEELRGRPVSWTSDAPSVATVDGAGVVTAVAPGTATIAATSEGVSGTGALSVEVAESSDALVIVSGDGQAGPFDVPLPDSLVVEVRGAGGDLESGVTVDWSISSGDGTLHTTRSVSDGRGRAAALVAPGSGTMGVRALASGRSSVTFTVTGTAPGEGTVYFGRNGYVEYRPGTLPLILAAPHGGTIEPAEIPARAGGTQGRDYGTDQAAIRIADQLEARTGERPHLIVFHLSRTRVDANRDIGEGTEGHPLGRHAWLEFQSLVDHARTRVADAHGKGLFVDLHLHGHAIQRLELGYLLSASDLRESDEQLNGRAGSSSIAGLVQRTGRPLSTLLRGPSSLGDRFVAEGFPAVPSSDDPAPSPGEPYFTGGYNTARWGSRGGGVIDAVQIEANAEAFFPDPVRAAAAAAAVLAGFIADWY